MYLPARTRSGTGRLQETLGNLELESLTPIIPFTSNTIPYKDYTVQYPSAF